MGDEQEPVLNGRALSELKVVELKEELGKRGLSKIGNKNVLYERLKEHLVGTVTVSDESEQESMVKPIADGSGSPSANPFVAEYLAKQQVALLAARKDAEAARRAVSTSDEQASSPQEKSPPVSRRSDAVKRSESEQLSGTPERRATRRSPRLGSPQKDHEKVSAGETNGKEALNDAERGNSSVSQSDGKQKSNRNETAQEVRADDKREIKLEGSESSQHVTEGSARRERSGEVTAEAVVEDVSDGTCGSVRLNEMSKKEPSEVHVDESEASSSSFSTPAEQLRQKDKSVELKTESTEVSSEIGRGSDVSAASPKLDASAAAAAETSLGRGAKGESSKNESVAKTSVKMVDEVGEMEIALIDGAKRDETCSENVSKEERMVSEHFTLKEASGSSSVMAARHPEEADDSSAKVENEEQKEEGDAKDVASLNSSDNSHASTAESRDGITEEMRRWKGWKDGVADEEENVVMVDVHVSSKSPERVKAVDGMLDESREGSSPSVSDDLVERSSRREKRSVSPSPSDGRTAASEYLDHGDDFKEKTEELDYEEVPQQPSIDSSYENVKSEPAEGSVHVSTKKASRSSEGRLRAAIHESNETAVRNATVDGFVRERSVTPARYPVNQVLMIRQLTRPFTSKQLQQMLSTFGTIVEGGFWIDNIKSTCIVKYSSVEEAIVARGRLHNVVWPPHSPKALKVDYSDDEGLARHIAYETRASNIKAKRPSDGGRSLPEAMATSTLRVSVSVNREERSVQPASARDRTHKEREHGLKAREGATERKKAHSRSPPNRDGAPSEKRRREGRRDPSRDERKHRSSPESRAVRQEPEKSVKTADELFKKTTTQPAIYYVALTDEQVAERSKRKAAEAEMLAAKRAAAALNQRKETKSKEEKTKTTVGPEGVRHARSRSPRAARTTRRSPHSRSPRHRR